MLKNPILQKVQAEIEKSVTDRASFDKIMDAAMKAIYDKNVFTRIAKGMAESKDPVGDAARGVVGIMAVLASKSQGTMPGGPAIQAGMCVMLDALDFLEQAGLIKVDNPTLEKALNDYIEALLPNTGLTSDKLSAALQQISPVLADEKRMAQYQQSIKGGA